jgi:hypothetical protein
MTDHDRSCCPGTGSCGKCVRGLLCNPCNLMIGHAHDEQERLRAAIQYLADWAVRLHQAGVVPSQDQRAEPVPERMQRLDAPITLF